MAIADTKKHVIALGGLGGDSHSVGLILLRWSLRRRGYHVIYLGTQNTVHDFFDIAPYVNIVMMTCLDGHAHHYLREFPKIKAEHDSTALWYIGGNPSVNTSPLAEREFIEMGFDRAFLSFVELEVVFQSVEKDLYEVEGRYFQEAIVHELTKVNKNVFALPDDEKMSPDMHARQRKQVLQHWPTGADAADMDVSAEYLAKVEHLADWERDVQNGKRDMLVQARTGVALAEQQYNLFLGVLAAGATSASFQVDSLTRNNNYAEAVYGVRESAISQSSTINGYPAVNHGVVPLRKISAALKHPLQMRHSTRDPRLLAEITMAGGVSAFEGGAICYNIPYYKNYPLEESIRMWQYVDRLCGMYYEKYGLRIHREYFGVLSGTLIPPCIAISTSVLEALLAAQQGVVAVSIGFAEIGHRSQDVAAIRAIRKIARKYLDQFGYKSVQVSAVFNQYMAAFPQQHFKARQLIRGSAATAALGKADRILTKTPVEVYKIPSLSDNVEGLSINRQGFLDAKNLKLNEAQVQLEENLIVAECTAIIDQVITLGRGNLAHGIVSAFKTGALDVPFAPSIYNHGQAMAMRDQQGALRFVSVGNLPIPKETKQYHAEKITERRRLANIKEGEEYRLVETDLIRVVRGQFDVWPLDAALH